MKLPTSIAQWPHAVRWFMAAAWLMIAFKCAAVWWAVERWHMPFHPLWIVAPTVVFASLGTVLWLGHREN